jgi:dTDP-4-dehydrorhamnose reductase
MTATIWVTGANGQLGSELKALAPRFPQYQWLFTTKEQCSIDDTMAVQELISLHRPFVCINTAAYTAVDKAETASEMAFAINATAAGELARLCYENACGFIHISTDYVFNGNTTRAYTEDDSVDPINTYGASKLAGEKLVQSFHPGAIIIRTSWLYSRFGHNFVKTMLRLMQERAQVRVVNDQMGCPTWAADLALAIIHIVNHPKPPTPNTNNLFHFCNQQPTTWFAFAQAIRSFTHSSCEVLGITSAEYPTAAKRPAHSVLDTRKIQQVFGINIPAWETSLQQCLTEMKA